MVYENSLHNLTNVCKITYKMIKLMVDDFFMFTITMKFDIQ